MMTISERKQFLIKESDAAEYLLRQNIENYKVSDFLPSIGSLLSKAPDIVQDNPKDTVKIASLISSQVLDDDNIINLILKFVKRTLFIASLFKKS